MPRIDSSLITRPSREKAGKAQEERSRETRQEGMDLRRRLTLPDSASDADGDFDDGSDGQPRDDDPACLPGEAFEPGMRFTASSGLRFAVGQRDLRTVVTDAAHTRIVSATVQDSAVRGGTNAKVGQSAHRPRDAAWREPGGPSAGATTRNGTTSSPIARAARPKRTTWSPRAPRATAAC